MKKTQFFIISTIIMTGIVISTLFLSDSQSTIASWLISDIALGAILYLSYLAIGMSHAHTQEIDSTELAIFC